MYTLYLQFSHCSARGIALLRDELGHVAADEYVQNLHSIAHCHLDIRILRTARITLFNYEKYLRSMPNRGKLKKMLS